MKALLMPAGVAVAVHLGQARYYHRQNMDKVTDTRAFLAELEGISSDKQKAPQSLTQTSAAKPELSKQDYVNLSPLELAQTLEKKMSEVIGGNSARFTRADQADDFDMYDVHAVEIANAEKNVESTYKNELQRAKVEEIQTLTQMLTTHVVALTKSDTPSRKELLDLSNELDSFKKKAVEFNKISLADSNVKKANQELEAAFGPFQDRAFNFKAIALAEQQAQQLDALKAAKDQIDQSRGALEVVKSKKQPKKSKKVGSKSKRLAKKDDDDEPEVDDDGKIVYDPVDTVNYNSDAYKTHLAGEKARDDSFRPIVSESDRAMENSERMQDTVEERNKDFADFDEETRAATQAKLEENEKFEWLDRSSDDKIWGAEANALAQDDKKVLNDQLKKSDEKVDKWNKHASKVKENEQEIDSIVAEATKFVDDVTKGEWVDTTPKKHGKHSHKHHKKADKKLNKMLDEYEDTEDKAEESKEVEKMISVAQTQQKYEDFKPNAIDRLDSEEEQEKGVDLESEIRKEMDNIFQGKKENDHKAEKPSNHLTSSDGVPVKHHHSLPTIESQDRSVFEEKAASAITQAEELEKQFEKLTETKINSQTAPKTVAALDKADDSKDADEDESEDEQEEEEAQDYDEKDLDEEDESK